MHRTLVAATALSVAVTVCAGEHPLADRFTLDQTPFALPPESAYPGLPVSNATHSFWTHGAPDANPLAKTGSIGPLTDDADVCIIGSGITGVGAAYHLSRIVRMDALSPLKTVIFEARDFCSGATGRNGGHLTPALFASFRRRAARFGTREAVKTMALERHTVDRILDIIDAEKLGQAVDLVSGGHVQLVHDDAERRAIENDIEAAREAGVGMASLEWIDEARMKREYGASYPAFRWEGHNLWPLKLVTHLYTLANRTSARALSLHTHTPVLSISPFVHASSNTTSPTIARRWTLHTPRGPVSCGLVLHATNAYAAHLLPHLHGALVPVRGQVIATRAAVPARELRPSSYGNGGGEYWFPRPVPAGHNGTELDAPLVILGGARHAVHGMEADVTDDGAVNPVVGRALRRFLPAVFPGKFARGVEPEMEWTGIMAFTKLGDPFVGPVVLANGVALSGQYVAAGYSGHGMPRAFSCAEVAAQMIAADIAGTNWTAPDWLPAHYLTQPDAF